MYPPGQFSARNLLISGLIYICEDLGLSINRR